MLGGVGCGYSWKQALQDAKQKDVTKRQKSFRYFRKYLTEELGKRNSVNRRKDALDAIYQTGLPRAAGIMRMVLMHEKDSSLRLMALRGLAELRAKGALEEVKDALLEDRDPRVRMTAAAALGGLGDMRALGALYKALKDPKSSTRAAAARALAVLKSNTSVKHLMVLLDDHSQQVRDAARLAMLEIGKGAVPYLIRDVKGSDAGRRRRALSMLSQMGRPAFDALIMVFPEKKTRTKVAEALSNITQDQDSWEYLGKLIDAGGKSEDGESKELGALMQVGTLWAIKAIFMLWDSIPLTARSQLRATIGKIAARFDEKGRELLYNVAKTNSNLAIRSTAIFALGYTGNDALLRLEVFLKSKQPAIKYSAIRALGDIGREAFSTLRPFMTSSDEKVRLLALHVAGKVQDSTCVDVLIEQLEDKSSKVRMAALSSLGRLKDLRAVKPVRKMLKDPDAKVMLKAVQALISLGDQENVPMYITAIKRGPYPPDASYVRTLGKIGAREIIPVMEKLMLRYFKDWKDYLRKVRRKHRKLARKIGRKKAMEKAKEALSEHPARQPEAICCFVEAMRSMVQVGASVRKIFKKARYKHSYPFNPLRRTPLNCPWPRFF
tara:strand:+ start:9439 stop:11262 length:1824 start_codon:yes stop_codon:yes gene_type:complete